MYRMWFQDYTLESIASELEAGGFTDESLWSDLTGASFADVSKWIGLVTRKG